MLYYKMPAHYKHAHMQIMCFHLKLIACSATYTARNEHYAYLSMAALCLLRHGLLCLALFARPPAQMMSLAL